MEKKWGRSQIEIFSVQSPVIVYEKPRLRDKKYFAFGNLHVLGYMKDHPNELFSFDVYEFSSYKGLSAQDGVLNYLILTHILMPALQADGKFGATVLGSNGLDIFNSEEHLAVRVLDILQSQFGVVDKKSLSKILGIDSRGWNRIITTTGAGQ